MGLREQKKQKVWDSITQNAKALFLSKGYDGLTMEEIAIAAEIGVGTLYNYYDSKSDIFLAIMLNELHFSVEEIKQLPCDSKTSSFNHVMAYIWEIAKPFQLINKDMWQELISLALKAKNENILLQKLFKLDNQLIFQLEKLIDYHIEHGTFREDFPSHQVAGAIYSIILTQFLFYLYNKETTYKQFISRVEEQIKCVIQE